jgi:hypothetical protein
MLIPGFFGGIPWCPEKPGISLESILNWLYLSFQPGRGRKPASWWEGGPEGLEQKKKIKVDKQEKLYIMGYYEN